MIDEENYLDARAELETAMETFYKATKKVGLNVVSELNDIFYDTTGDTIKAVKKGGS